MGKMFFVALLTLLLSAAVIVGSGTQKNNTDVKSTKITATRVIEKSPERPVLLVIPKLNIRATVESVGMDAKGRMDIPKNPDNVAWYNLGSKPAEVGNAVMAGHFDKATGAPAVFYAIHTLSPGDKIISTDIKGDRYTFSVVRVVDYPYDKFPLQEVFGSSDTPMLNLITCQGNWNKKTQNYSHRTVVFATKMK